MSIWNSYSNKGLGDYIHCYPSNYWAFGINRRFGNNGNFTGSAVAAYQEAKATALKTKTNTSNTQAIADFYTALMRQNYKDASAALGTNEVIDYTKMEADFHKAINNKLSSSIGKAVDRASLGVTSIGGIQRISYSGLKDKDRKSIRRSTIESLIPKVRACIKTLINEYSRGLTRGMNQDSLMKLKKSISELMTMRQMLSQIAKEMHASNEYLKSFRYSDGSNNYLGDILTNLDYLTKAYTTPTKSEIGYVAEYFTAAGAAIAGGKVQETTAELLDSFVIGNTGSNTTLQVSGDFVDRNILKQALNKASFGNDTWSLDEEGNILVSSHTSQDTVDVQINFKDANNIFGTDQLRASVKNYFDPTTLTETHPGVSVISGAPLTSLLGLMNSNFSNHYLNYLAGNGISGRDFEYGNNVMKYILAVRGLSGARNSASSKLSQYFIVFSRKDKRVYVFTTMDLLNKISPSPGVFNDNYALVTGMPSMGALKSANKYVNVTSTVEAAVQQRIASVIAGAHAFKLSMSLMPGIFT